MFVDSYKNVNVVTPATITTTTTHTYVDLGGYASQANRGEKFTFALGGVAGTSPSITIAVTECDTTNGTYAAPPAGTTSTSALTTNGVYSVDVFRTKRYVQIVSTFTSNTTSANIGVQATVLKRDSAL